MNPHRMELRPDWRGPSTPFRHTWEGIVNVDQFRWLVRGDMQDQLSLAREELGARHVRAVGMFDDEMRVFAPSPGSFMGYEPKDPRTNWQMLDYVFDALLQRGLRPMFTTTFIPGAMASGSTRVFTTQAHTSPPRDWRQWERFVRESVAHAVERYTLPVVQDWYFEVWNEPNLAGWFWGGSQEDFFRLWQVTHGAIKSVAPTLRVGGPSTAHAEWIAELIEFGQGHGCTPDYLITHMYNNDGTAGRPLAPFDGPQADKTSQSPNSCIGVMRGMRDLVDRLGFRGELHWNEWGRSFHGVDGSREEPSEGAFVARVMDHVSQDADVFSYWCLSDIYDQVGFGREAFYGGYGLLSLQGLRKPAYQVFQLLHRLGDRRFGLAPPNGNSLHGAIATGTPDGRCQLLVYAYDHASSPDHATLEVTVELPPRSRVSTLYRVDRTENNVVAHWRELGAPAYLSPAQTRLLRAENRLKPGMESLRVTGGEGRAEARFSLGSPGVALLEVEPVA